MVRFRWTDEAIAELRRLMNFDLSYEEIAARLGEPCNANSARCRAYKMGFTSHGRAGRVRGDRLRGKKRSAAVKAKMSEKARARWSDPTFRARVVPIIAETNRKPARCAKISRYQDRRRGFRRPPLDHDYWAFLSAGYAVREAAIASKLIDQSQAPGGR